MNGYHNRVAWIDLTQRRIDFRPFEAGDAGNFIGGGMMGAAILARLTNGDVDPLGPDNPLIFMTGPFTATSAPSGSRFSVVSMSPLTGIFGEATCGGGFGFQLKRSGLDGIVLTGISDSPVVLVIDGEKIAFRDAEDLWGRDYYVTDEQMKDEYGKGAVTAMIGPAGENLVPLACICSNGRHTRVAGRTGMGAVMGSKKVKGIVVRGGSKIETPLADAAGLKASTRATVPGYQERLGPWAVNGTPNAVQFFERVGNLPINNWRDARNPHIGASTTGASIYDSIQVKRAGCKSCPVICGRTVEVTDGEYATEGVVEGPEYETLALFGANQMVDDVKAITKANELCNRLGLDTMSTAGVIAFANECWEKGVLTKADTGGLELGFGKGVPILALIRRMAGAEDDVSRALGGGSRHAASVFGGDSDEYSVQCKGLEFPAHDPRYSWGQALSYATGPRGACHLSSLAGSWETGEDPIPELGYPEPHPAQEREGKAEFTIKTQNLMNVLDSLVVCKFSMFREGATVTNFLDWYNLITGAGIDQDGLMDAGDRGFTLKRMINNRCGITRKDDILPPRMRTLKRIGEDVNLDVPPLAPMLSDYYQLRGWTEEGRPSAETVKRLGLGGWG
jgi:aldehyde:ferredoxin oxidoreductase